MCKCPNSMNYHGQELYQQHEGEQNQDNETYNTRNQKESRLKGNDKNRYNRIPLPSPDTKWKRTPKKTT